MARPIASQTSRRTHVTSGSDNTLYDIVKYKEAIDRF